MTNQILGTTIITLSYVFMLLSFVVPSLVAGFVPYNPLIGVALEILYLLTSLSGFGIRRGRRWGLLLYSLATLVGAPILFLSSANAPAQQAFQTLTSPLLILLLGPLFLLRRSTPLGPVTSLGGDDQ